jgi:hypothetical protein
MPCIHSWILWTNVQVSGSTKHNKALHLIKLLNWLADKALEASGATAKKGVKRCLKKLWCFLENSKQQYLCAVSKVMDKDKLIECGATLHKSEQPAFILWLLQRISKCADFFLVMEEETTAAAPTGTTAPMPTKKEQVVQVLQAHACVCVCCVCVCVCVVHVLCVGVGVCVCVVFWCLCVGGYICIYSANKFVVPFDKL